MGIDSMVNASLNWASIVGLLVFVYGLAAAPLAFAQIFFTLQRRADTSPAVIAKTLILFVQALGRAIGLQHSKGTRPRALGKENRRGRPGEESP